MVHTVSRVPLTTGPQILSVDIAGASYRMRMTYCDADEGGWLINLSDADDQPIVHGIPLLPKSNLLAQYGYLGLTFGLFLVNAADPDARPAFDDLGRSSQLYVLQRQ